MKNIIFSFLHQKTLIGQGLCQTEFQSQQKAVGQFKRLQVVCFFPTQLIKIDIKKQ